MLEKTILSVIAGSLAVAAAAAAPVPKIAPGESPAAVANPYDEGADAKAAVAQALARAGSAHKFVLLDFGGNWCPDCRILAGVLALPDVKPAVDKTFEVVSIDIGRLNKNLDIAQAYGVTVKAVPRVIILDSQGHMVNGGSTPTALSDARNMDPQSVVDTIFGWTGAAP